MKRSKADDLRRAERTVNTIVVILLLVFLWLMFGPALGAGAAADIGEGVCVQDDGAVGVWNGSTADDEGCITVAEYQVRFGEKALDQVLAVGPDPEPEAITVSEWFDTTIRRMIGPW